MDEAAITMERIGGYTLRVATWRLKAQRSKAGDLTSRRQRSSGVMRNDVPPLLFLNGIGANIETLFPMARAMPDRAFIAIDMPGTGGSPDPMWPYNTYTMSWIIAQLLARLGTGAVDVIGLSWGGALAQHFALQHPACVRKLVLAASAPGMAMVPGDLSVLGAMADPMRSGDPAVMNELFAALYGPAADGISRADTRKHIARLTPPSPIGFACQAMALAGWTSLPALPFLNTPTLILTGTDDAIVPPVNANVLHSAIPRSQLVLIEGAGHLFLLTHMDKSLAAIRAFLDETSVPRKAA